MSWPPRESTTTICPTVFHVFGLYIFLLRSLVVQVGLMLTMSSTALGFQTHEAMSCFLRGFWRFEFRFSHLSIKLSSLISLSRMYYLKVPEARSPSSYSRSKTLRPAPLWRLQWRLLPTFASCGELSVFVWWLVFPPSSRGTSLSSAPIDVFAGLLAFLIFYFYLFIYCLLTLTLVLLSLSYKGPDDVLNSPR